MYEEYENHTPFWEVENERRFFLLYIYATSYHVLMDNNRNS
jgi:hypothetical protein